MTKFGIFPGVDNDEYRAWPYLSQTRIKRGRISMLHMQSMKWGKTTPAMDFGSIVHLARLEEDRLGDMVAICPHQDKNRTHKAWKDWRKEQTAPYCLTHSEGERFNECARAVWSRTSHWLPGDAEVSAIGAIAGVIIKGRADWIEATTSKRIGRDIKVGSDGDSDFPTKAYKHGYHIQAFVYMRLFGLDEFWFTRVESDNPFDVVEYKCSDRFIEAGKHETLSILERWKAAKANNVFPGRDGGNGPITLDPPAWVDKLLDQNRAPVLESDIPF